MFSSFKLNFQFNSVQRLFLIQLNIAAHGNILKEGQRVGQLCIEPNGVTIGFIGRKLYLNNRYRSDSEQIIHWKMKMPASVYELLVSVENSRFFVFY